MIKKPDFNARSEPRPEPGVTVRIFPHRSDLPDTVFHWTGVIDGVDRFEFSVDSEGEFPTPEDAEAHCRKHLAELALALLPSLPLAMDDCQDLNINFTRE